LSKANLGGARLVDCYLSVRHQNHGLYRSHFVSMLHLVEKAGYRCATEPTAD
jgi:hypothetical protein